jgi:hypothetical protein
LREKREGLGFTSSPDSSEAEAGSRLLEVEAAAAEVVGAAPRWLVRPLMAAAAAKVGAAASLRVLAERT